MEKKTTEAFQNKDNPHCNMTDLLMAGLQKKLTDRIAGDVIEKYTRMAHEEIKATVMEEIEKYAIEDIRTLRDELRMSEQILLKVYKNDELVTKSEV